MSKKVTWLGTLVMVLAFGMTVVGCDNDPTNGNGDIIFSGGMADMTLSEFNTFRAGFGHGNQFSNIRMKIYRV